jgi:hypothetical protein
MPPTGSYPKASSIHYTYLLTPHMLNINFSIFFHINLGVPHISPTPIHFFTCLHEETKAHKLQVHHTIFGDVNEYVEKNTPDTLKDITLCAYVCVLCVCVCVVCVSMRV